LGVHKWVVATRHGNPFQVVVANVAVSRPDANTARACLMNGFWL
jgi:hypothetical protein